MEIKIFVLAAVIIVCFIGGIILGSIHLFEKDINKKIDKLNDKIDDIGYEIDDISYKTNNIDSRQRDIYAQLISMSHRIDSLIHTIENLNADNDKSKNKKSTTHKLKTCGLVTDV